MNVPIWYSLLCSFRLLYTFLHLKKKEKQKKGKEM